MLRDPSLHSSLGCSLRVLHCRDLHYRLYLLIGFLCGFRLGILSWIAPYSSQVHDDLFGLIYRGVFWILQL